jgi:omega-hydroxy-beta-dihydromenaquinone-9 sulfotransferase
MNQQLIRQMKILYDNYFMQRALIPLGRLHEVAFEDLERDPVGQLRLIYQALQLPDFSYVERPLTAYLKTIADYKKNVLEPLPDALRKQVHRECRRCFDEWGYAA